MKTVLKILIILFFAAIIAVTVIFLVKKSKKTPEIFETSTAVETTIINKTVATGSVVPRKEIEIKPQVSGIIEKIYVEAGDTIVSGDLIAKVKIIPNMVSLNNAESRLNKAELSLQNLTKEYKRQKQLYEKNVVSESVYLQYDLEYKQAKEEVDAAENNLQLIKEGITKKSASATNTLIRSTISGMILDVPIEEGNSVIESNTFNDGTSIAIIANMDDMVFEGKVDESEVGKIKEGMPLILTIGAIENESFEATLEYIAPKGVNENGAIQFEIRADVNLKKDQFIRAGYSATADIVLDSRENVLAINESLLQFDQTTNKPFVEIEKGEQQFERVDVELGLSDGINVEVLSGLTKDDKIKVWNKAFGMTPQY